MKRVTLIIFLLFISVAIYGQKAKYVFFLIGDGMGQNIVHAAECYKNYQDNGVFENGSLTFTSFPVFGISTTNSATKYITDSAAAGTALATGEKTSIGTIGLNTDHSEKLKSMAYDAKESKKVVGIITTMAIDHATPASFYASQPSRDMSYEIAMDGITAGFDLYGGAGFKDPTPTGKPEVYSSYQKAGYTIIRGRKELSKMNSVNSKILIAERSQELAASFNFAIDRTEDDLSLSELLTVSIEYLAKKGGRNGFFIMAESGRIDRAGHRNDGKTKLLEVLDFDNAVNIAYEFYKKYPKETLIVVTADHETGGFALGNASASSNLYVPDLDIKILDKQSLSEGKLSEKIDSQTKNWAECKELLKAELGLWDDVKVSNESEDRMIIAYSKDKKELLRLTFQTLMDAAGIGWTSYKHTGSPVGVYAIGVGSEKFRGKQDNTDIAKSIKALL